jgi:AcrR family transcriptional regulator
MAYRKTEKVLADLEAVRNGIIASAIDVIRKSGRDGLTMDAVKARAGCSVGALYNRFPDLTELLAAITAQLLARDTQAMRTAGTLAGALAVLHARLECPNLLRLLMEQPGYRLGIRAELETLIGGRASKARSMAAAGAMGALAGLADVNDGSENNAPEALLLALRAIGMTDAAARKAVDRRQAVPA